MDWGLDQYRKERAPLFRRGGRGRRIAAASAITLGLLGLTSVGVTSIVAPSAVAAALRDPASLFAQRSPGQRGLALLQTKHKRAAPAAPARDGPAADHAQGPRPEPAPVFALIEPGEEMPPLVYKQGQPGPGWSPPPLADVELPPQDIGGPPGGGDIPTLQDIPGGGGGGGGGLIPVTETSVPEPSVWAMLITGFFGVGAMLRVRRRDSRRLAHGARA